MTASQVIEQLWQLGVKIKVDGDDLTLTAPRGTLDESLLEQIRVEKRALILDLEEQAQNPRPRLKRLNEIDGMSRMARIAAMRERGQVPDTYTSSTVCKWCGPVPIWQGCPPRVESCPWCFNRLQGLPIPIAKC